MFFTSESLPCRPKRLASGANIRTPFPLKTSNDPAAVIWAVLPFFPIDQMPPLVLSLRSIGGKKIPDARSTTGNRLLENLPHNPIEPFHFSLGKPSDLHVRVKACPEEYFIGVDVSDAGNDLLMHQKRLQPTASFSQNSSKIRLRHEKRINPESASEISLKPRLVQQRKTTEATRVPVP